MALPARARIRGDDRRQDVLFSYLSIEERIPPDHPLRAIRALVEPVLAALSPRFQTMYSAIGRPSIPPEQLLRALLLQILFTIRSERQLMEQLNCNLLCRWFVGLAPDDPVWMPTVFTKNRDRLLPGNIAAAFGQEILGAADTRGLLSHEHCTVDGTLLEAWASPKSFRPKDDPSPPSSDGDPKNPTVNCRKEKRSHATHRSVSDPDARLARKSTGTTAKLCHLGSTLMDNRHGLVVATDVPPPDYDGERDAALEMLTTLELAPESGPDQLRPGGLEAGYRHPFEVVATSAAEELRIGETDDVLSDHADVLPSEYKHELERIIFRPGAHALRRARRNIDREAPPVIWEYLGTDCIRPEPGDDPDRPPRNGRRAVLPRAPQPVVLIGEASVAVTNGLRLGVLGCDACAHEYLLAFSCKCRYFCPSGHAKRLARWSRWLDATLLAVHGHERGSERGDGPGAEGHPCGIRRGGRPLPHGVNQGASVRRPAVLSPRAGDRRPPDLPGQGVRRGRSPERHRYPVQTSPDLCAVGAADPGSLPGFRRR